MARQALGWGQACGKGLHPHPGGYLPCSVGSGTQGNGGFELRQSWCPWLLTPDTCPEKPSWRRCQLAPSLLTTRPSLSRCGGLSPQWTTWTPTSRATSRASARPCTQPPRRAPWRSATCCYRSAWAALCLSGQAPGRPLPGPSSAPAHTPPPRRLEPTSTQWTSSSGRR